MAKSSYKQRLIGCEVNSGNILSTVLETGGYKDCSLMAVVRIVPGTRPRVKRREIENTVVGAERNSFLFIWGKSGKLNVRNITSTLSLDA